MPTDLLPPNASALEVALDRAIARVGDVDVDLAALWDPATIDATLLPWLAWGLSVDTWDADWTEAAKRAAVAGSIALHRRKGTRLSVEDVLQRFDDLLSLVEWHQAEPPATPHTFDILLPMVTAGPGGTAVAAGGRRTTAAFAEAIVREVDRVAPLREHMRLVQTIAAAGFVGIQGVARAAVFLRHPVDLTADTSPAWAAYLQTEDGEPLQDDAGGFWDTAP